MFDIDVLKGWIASIIRLVAASTLTWLIAHGYLTTESAAQMVLIVAGAAAVLVSALIGRIWTNQKVEKALDMPKGTSKETLKEVIAGGR